MGDEYIYDDSYNQIKCIEFDVLGGPEIKRMSALGNGPGTSTTELYEANGEPKKDGLVDPRLGTCSNDVLCATCGLNTTYCVGHFGHIDLAEIVFHVGYLAFVQKILSCICPRCSNLLVYKNEDEMKELIKMKSGKERMTYIRALSKNITYCQNTAFGCGAQIPKIKVDIKKTSAVINVIAETELDNKDDNDGKKKLRQILTPEIITDILKNISDDNCRILGMDPTRSRPEDMIHKIFPVPPVQMRPSARGDYMGGASMEDDLTVKLADIVKSNLRIIKNKENQTENNSKYNPDYAHLLQVHVGTYFEHESMMLPKSEQKGRVIKSLSSRLKGKPGRVRSNLMAKRGDFTARTVITSDPTIGNNQLGVPVKIAMNLTFPETVTPHNIDYLNKLVKNGRDVYPGANFVFPISRTGAGKRLLPIDLRYKKEATELHFGDVVERHLKDGDIVLLNRQPTLHKQSMMGHRIKVINDPSLMTYRLSVAITTPYNADFDGDEMNIFVPQTLQTQIELEEIACVEKQIITPTTSKTIIGIVQDGLLGAYNLTAPSLRIDWRSAMNIMSYTSIEDFSNIKKNKDYTGSELYSLIIPPGININRQTLKIKNGKLTDGRLTKDALGAKKKNNLVQLIWDGYGVESTKQFIDDTQRLINNFNLWHGFSVGVGDVYIPPKVYDQINLMFQTKELKVEQLITEVENNPEFMTQDLFEHKLFSELNIVRDDVSKIIIENMSPTNSFNVMLLSGSKGDEKNIGQMAGCLGLQTFEGKIVPKKYNNRTLAYYHQHDDRASSRGLVKQCFVKGLEFPEFVFHLMASRLGIIDTAIKSVTGDTPIIIHENGNTKRVLIGDWIDEHMKNNENDIKHEKEKDMELLELNTTTYIPTSNNKGHVTWELITAVTRHDHENELYEFETIGGRKVIVVQSKSLLIWNESIKEFEQVLTKDIKIGDFMPVTANLPNIGNTSKSDKMTQSAHIKLEYTKDNGVFFGLLLGSMTKFITDEVLTAPNDFIAGVLGGYSSRNTTVEKDSIVISANSERLVEGLNILCNRLGIFGTIGCINDSANDKKYTLTIKDKWTKVFANKVTIIDEEKMKKVKKIPYSIDKMDFTPVNDVVLDQIVKITKIDASKYAKVYDLTVPKTLNFQIANGLTCADTAETGYTQRKLIKSMEDIMVRYDSTVRNSNDKIIQFVYGDSGVDTTKQYEYLLHIIEMGNQTIKDKFLFNNSELKSVKGASEKINTKIYDTIIELRDTIRTSTMKSTMSYISLKDKFMIPVNINRIVDTVIGMENLSKQSSDLTPGYVLEQIEMLLRNDKTTLIYMTEEERNNPNSLKRKDEELHKTVFRAVVYDSLNPKRMIVTLNVSKMQFDKIVLEVIDNFNKNMIEPGEMAGILAGQSTGEPLTQMTLNSFHHSGIASMSATVQGVPRMKELLSVSKKPKTPQMIIYLTEEYMGNKDMAHKIASHIKHTTLSDIRGKITVYYDPNPKATGGFMENDNVKNAFYNHKGTKGDCSTSDITGLPWLMRIELDREKMLDKDVTLLDIKKKFCSWWDRRIIDSKTMKKEEKKVLNKITHLAVLSNTDNDKQPILHVRFNVKDIDRDKDKFDTNTIDGFIDHIIDKFKLKGIQSITDISAIREEKIIQFSKKTGEMEKTTQYVIYASGVNFNDIRYLTGIDLKKTISNHVMEVYNIFGIEIARSILLREIANAYERAGGEVNYQHITMIVDQMTSSGSINSIDRHGMNKSDSDPLSRASFEKTVEQLLTAAVYGETDQMKGVSSRITVGAVIRGGTGYCQLELDTEMIEKSEYNEDADYGKKFTELNAGTLAKDIIGKKDNHVFIPI